MTKILKNKDFIWNTIGTLVYAMVLIFLTMAVSRINGGISSGNFTFSFNMAQIFWLFAAFGIRNYQVTDIKNEYSHKAYFQSRIFTCLVSFVLAVIFCLINHYSVEMSSLIIIFTLYRLLDAFSDVLHGFLQSNGRLYQAGISLTVKSAFGVIIFIIIDFITKNIYLSGLSLTIVNLIWITIYELKRVQEIPIKLTDLFNFKNKGRQSFGLLTQTWPLMLQLVFSSVFLNVTRYFIQMWHGNLQSFYGIIFLPISFMTVIINTILAPQMVGLAASKKKDIRFFEKKVNKIFVICLSLGLFALIFTWLIGVQILTRLFSINVLPYRINFFIIVLSGLFLGGGYLIFNILTIFRSLFSQVIISGISILAQILLAIYLVKFQEITGAVISLLVSSFILCMISFLTLKFYIRKEKFNK